MKQIRYITVVLSAPDISGIFNHWYYSFIWWHSSLYIITCSAPQVVCGIVATGTVTVENGTITAIDIVL